jgi:hypothetical protein
MINEIWKDCPITFNKQYQISNLGNIRFYDNKTKTFITKHQSKDENGYMFINITLSNGKYSAIFVHRLVAITFISIPLNLEQNTTYRFKDNVPYIVNHKDGNKQNNYYKNLEWCDTKHNIKHSIDNNLRNSNFRVIVYDSELKENFLFNSANSLANFLNIHHKEIRTIVSSFNDKLFRNRYIFKLLDIRNSTSKTGQHRCKNIICKDYITGKIFIFESIAKASEFTQIKYKVIQTRCYRNEQNNNNFTDDIYGYEFLFLHTGSKINKPNFISIEINKAKENREKYFQKLYTDNDLNKSKIETYNTITNEIILYNSINEACVKNNINRGSLHTYIIRDKYRNRKLPIINNLKYKLLSDKRSWDA